MNFRAIFLSLSFFLLAPSASAATLAMTGAHPAVGDTFSITILLSTAAGESANAVSSTISYPQNLLSIVGISKSGSIISLWPQDPQYAEAGSADFQGIVLNPGYTGSSGTVLTLTFRAKAAGQAMLAFNNSSVLANDGQGTDILSAAYGTSFAVTGSTPSPIVPTPESASSIPTPKITSSTYPDSSAWYATTTGAFAWSVPAGVTAVRISYDHSASGVPSVSYVPAITKKTITVGPDGVYYFHAQFKTADGWGPIASYMFQVDTTPPVMPNVRLAHPSNTTDPRPILLFNTTDALSGINHYSVTIDNAQSVTFTAADVTSNPYTPPWQSPGNKQVTVVAYDDAGNAATSTTTIHIDTIDPPIVTDYPSQINQGDLLRIRGTAAPASTVTILLRDPEGIIQSDTAISNSVGAWGLVWTHALDAGLYTFTASDQDPNGGVSNPTDPYNIRVNGTWGTTLTQFEFWGLGAAIIFLLLVLALWHLSPWGKNATPAGKLRSEEGSFLDELSIELTMLTRAAHRRALTKEEEVLLEHIKQRIKHLKRDLK